MSTEQSLRSTVDILIGALQNLRLRLRNPGHEAEDSDFVIVPSLEPEAPAGGSAPSSATHSRLVPWTAEWDEALQAAASLEELGELDLSPVEPLLPTSRLTSVRDWTPLLRLAASFRAGRGAFFVLQGESEKQGPSLGPPVRTCIYVVLRSRDHPHGFWTKNSHTFFEGVGDPLQARRGLFRSDVVCRSFASKAEAAAYLLGARAQWPRQLQ